MKCDTAFDLMTDPAGCASAALAQHLETCPRCRQMRDVLQPVLTFLAPSEEEPADGHSDWRESTDSGWQGRKPLVSFEAVRIAQHAAAELSESTAGPGSSRRSWVVHTLRYAAVFAAGAFLAASVVRNLESQPAAFGKCMRAQVGRQRNNQSPAESRAIILACVACHDEARKQIEKDAASIPIWRTNRRDWAAPIDDARPSRNARTA